MSRTILDIELQQLDEQTKRLGALVEDSLGKALEALETGDLAKASLVIESDTNIDSLRAAIEEHTFRLLTLHQTLHGRDLRYLTCRWRSGTHRRWCRRHRSNHFTDASSTE